MIFYYFIIAIFGLIVGSFLNAIIYRLHAEKSFLVGRSFCPECKHSLKTKDLIPVLSFILLKGRCRYCKKNISLQYPLVELSCALAFCLLFYIYGSSLAFFFYIIITSFLVVIFVYDLKNHLILDRVSVPGLILALIFSLILKLSFLDILLGGILGGGFFLLQFLVSKGKWIGGGDIRLGVFMGFVLGWQRLLVALFLAYFSGSLASLALIIHRKKKLKSRLAFGTFLTLATFFSILYGDYLIKWYLDGNLVNWFLY